MELRQFIMRLESDMLKTGALKMSRESAIAQGLCASCGEPALPKCSTEAGRKEYQVSGMCESCFDAATRLDEEE